MLINTIDLYSYDDGHSDLAGLISLAFRDPNSTQPYQVKAIMGLDADEIVPQYTGNPTDNAGGFYSPVMQKREITFLLGMNPDFDEVSTYSSLRDDIYKLVSRSRTGSVRIDFKLDDDTIAYLTGFVTKIEASYFEKVPAVQVTINCNRDPMLKAPTREIVNVAGVLVGRIATISDNVSTAAHGFRMAVRFSDDSDMFSLSDETGSYWKFSLTYEFKAADVLNFSSEFKSKYVYITRSGANIHIAEAIDAISVWPVMLPGENVYKLNSDAGVSLNSMSYVPTYWGV